MIAAAFEARKHAVYIQSAFDQQDLIDLAESELAGIEFDGMVGVGLSGSLVVPLLAYKLGKRFGIVRKGDDKATHSEFRVEHNLNKGDRWIFVDDFVCCGGTRQHAYDALKSLTGYEYAGTYLYHQQQNPRFTSAEDTWKLTR